MLNSVDAKACFFAFAWLFARRRRKNWNREPIVKAIFFFSLQEKPVLVRITSEGPSRENRLEEII